MEKIISKDNKKIKYILSLRKSNKRRKENLIVIEGKKEIGMAVSSGFEIKELYFCPEIAGAYVFKLQVQEVSKSVFEKISYRENPEGYLAIAVRPSMSMEKISLKKESLVLVLENMEKPGNVGAILRTADAVGVDAVVFCEQDSDIYNPNVIRASIGAIFSVPVITCSNDEALDFLQKNNLNIFSAIIENDSQDYSLQDFTKGFAIVIGTEHDGLSDFWNKNSKTKIKIPMKGKVDSLNASVSTAVILYEVLRQRGL